MYVLGELVLLKMATSDDVDLPRSESDCNDLPSPNSYMSNVSEPRLSDEGGVDDDLPDDMDLRSETGSPAHDAGPSQGDDVR